MWFYHSCTMGRWETKSSTSAMMKYCSKQKGEMQKAGLIKHDQWWQYSRFKRRFMYNHDPCRKKLFDFLDPWLPWTAPLAQQKRLLERLNPPADHNVFSFSYPQERANENTKESCQLSGGLHIFMFMFMLRYLNIYIHIYIHIYIYTYINMYIYIYV